MTHKPPLKLFVIYYDGLYMGGKAVVKAHNAKEAEELVKNDPKTVCFKDVTIEVVGAKERIIFNDNGDY